MTTDNSRPAMDKMARAGLSPGRSSGVVKNYNAKRNPFGGYITDDKTGQDIFVHKSAVAEAGFADLSSGQKIAFDVVADGFGGFKATKLEKLG